MKKIKPLLQITLLCLLIISLLIGCSPDASDTPWDAPDTNGDAQTPPVTNENNTNDIPGSNTDIIDDADRFFHSEGIDENGFWIGITALDYIELFDYMAIEIPTDIHYISDAILQNEINEILMGHGVFLPIVQVHDRTVINGDTINIDFVGSIDGVEFDGGNTHGMGTEVTIGVTSYIDDFLEQLIGHNPGDVVNVEVTFPDFYPGNPDLENKEALFITSINFIVEHEEVTDVIIAENFSQMYDWNTVDEMKNELITYMQSSAIRQFIQSFLATEVSVRSIPEELIIYQERAMIGSYQEYADMYEVDFDEFLQTFVGVSNLEELLEASYESNAEAAMFHLVIQAIAEDASISVSEEDMVRIFTEQVGTSDYMIYEEQLGLPFLKQFVLIELVMELLVKNAVLI
jgi:trigger factor